MGFSAAAKNYMLDQLGANRALYFSLHAADPGAAGDSELAGGSPAYARKPASWSPAAAGAKNLANSVTFDVPGGATVAFVGTWDSASGGVFQGGAPLGTPQPYSSQGTYTLTNPSSGGLASIGG